MALSSVPIPADPKRDASAAALVKTAHLWHTVTLREPHGSFPKGAQFLQTPCGWRCNAVACTCPDYEIRGMICKHIRTVVLLDAQQATPKPKATYATLYPSCRKAGCTDDPEPGSEDCWRHQIVDAF